MKPLVTKLANAVIYFWCFLVALIARDSMIELVDICALVMESAVCSALENSAKVPLGTIILCA